jgi:hypothetical protein
MTVVEKSRGKSGQAGLYVALLARFDPREPDTELPTDLTESFAAAANPLLLLILLRQLLLERLDVRLDVRL